MSGRVQKVMIPPINFVFKLLQQHTPVEIWLFEQVDLRIEGQIRGFDEFMNIILDDAVQIDTKQNRREIEKDIEPITKL